MDSFTTTGLDPVAVRKRCMWDRVGDASAIREGHGPASQYTRLPPTVVPCVHGGACLIVCLTTTGPMGLVVSSEILGCLFTYDNSQQAMYDHIKQAMDWTITQVIK